MSDPRQPSDSGPAWLPTLPCPLPDLPRTSARTQPPLVENDRLKGLDTRELEGQTVFDQLFGAAPAAPAARR